MGMFDHIRILGDDPRYVCAAGHRVADFQTKDLDESMSHYYIVEDRVFLRPNTEKSEYPVWIDDKLVLRSDVEVVASEMTSTVLAYTHCNACVPVFVDSDGAFSFDSIHAHHPDVRYAIDMRAGRVVRVSADRLQTRDDLRQELVAGGHRVLPDNDRIVQKHLEAHRREREQPHRSRR